LPFIGAYCATFAILQVLQPVLHRCATILVSDAGAHIGYEERIASDWVLHLRRVLAVEDNQVRSLRKVDLIDGYQRGTFRGAYWSIREDMSDYLRDAATPVSDALDAPVEATARLAGISTRLAAMDDVTQEQLINWGYAICDIAIRGMVEPAGRPPQFPYRRGIPV